LVGSEDGDGRTCAHPHDATTIAHTKSKLRDREFLSGAIESNSTMARTSKTSYIGGGAAWNWAARIFVWDKRFFHPNGGRRD
jgi:hypothetical protein